MQIKDIFSTSLSKFVSTLSAKIHSANQNRIVCHIALSSQQENQPIQDVF
jgi:hypothetical protein